MISRTACVLVAIAWLVQSLVLWTPMRRRVLHAEFLPRLVVQSLLLLGLCCAGFLLLGRTLHGISAEHYNLGSYAALIGIATIWAGVTTRRYQRLTVLEIFWAGLFIFEGALAWVLSFSHDHGLAATWLRAFIVLPPSWVLCTYFGASIGLVAFAAGRMDVRIGYESLIGRRFLLSKASPVLSVVTSISVVGVSLGVWLVLVSLGILSGFEEDLTEKIIGANAHIVIQRADQAPFAMPKELAKQIQEQVPGIQNVAPVLESEVAVASASNYAGAQIFGIDPRQSKAVLTLLQHVEEGSLEPLEAEFLRSHLQKSTDRRQVSADATVPPAQLGHLVLGRELAKSLNVHVGDKVRLISPTLQVLTPVGMAPKSLGFEVCAVFSSKMYEYDARYMFVSLPAAQRFLQLGPNDISGVQMACHDFEQAPSVGADALRVLEQLDARSTADAWDVLDWKKRNQTLFTALKLERVVAFIVLVFIILVASFSIVNTLTMSIIEKKSDIAILKTMGAPDAGILKLFLVQGLVVGVLGTAVGAIAGIVTMLALGHFGFWIPGEVYYIDSLPVRLNLQDVALVVTAALIIVWDFSVYPALRGSKLQPVEGLRDG